MAYLNEFPNLKPNELNLNWLLEQYASFNEKIEELHNHFDETINSINESLDNFEDRINTKFNEYKMELEEEISNISNAIEQISNNVAEYVNNHMEEWQLDAMTGENNDVVIGEFDPETPVTDGGILDTMIINNKKYLLGGYTWVGQIAENSTLNINLENNCRYEIFVFNWNYGVHRFFAWQGRGVVKVSGPTNTTSVVGSVLGAIGSIERDSIVNGIIRFATSAYLQSQEAEILIGSSGGLINSDVGTTNKTVLIDSSYVTATLNGNVVTLTNTNGNANHVPGVFIRKV